MKKILFAVLALVLAVGVALPMTMPGAAHTESEPYRVDLLAGQDEDVGDVLVWNDGTNLYVTYVITASDWEITATHLYVGKNPPPTSAPGQFPYDDAVAASVTPTEVAYVIPLNSICNYTMQLNSKGKVTGVMTTEGDVGVGPCEDVYIAAQAHVVRPIAGCWETVWQIGDVETYGCDSGTLLSNYADEFNWGYPAAPCTAGPTLAEETPAYTDPFIVGTTPPDEFPFNSNRNANYATDFDVQWSGGLLFGGQLTISWSPGASYPSETKVVSGDGISTTTFVHKGEPRSGEGWFLNKYPLYQDSVAVSPLSSGTHTINFRHTAGDGTYWDWVRLEEPCQQKETAWGEGDRIAANANWAMYFTYHVQCMPGTRWQIGTPDGAVNPIIGAAEFPVTGTVDEPSSWVWTASYDYTVGIDADPITEPSAPGYIGEGNVRQYVPPTDTRPPTDSTEVLNIHFTLLCSYDAGELVLYYDRYGSERDIILLDGVSIATVYATEGGYKAFAIPLPAVSSGPHTLTINYDDGYEDNGHYIDYLKLVYE